VNPGTVEQLVPKAMATLKSVPVQWAKTHCPMAAPEATQRQFRSVRVAPQADVAHAKAQGGIFVWPWMPRIKAPNVMNERSCMGCCYTFSRLSTGLLCCCVDEKPVAL
jgi:hypothetical protein